MKAAAWLDGLDVDTVAAWRLGMAQVAPFVATQPPELRQRVRAAIAEVGTDQPVRVLLLAGSVG